MGDLLNLEKFILRNPTISNEGRAMSMMFSVAEFCHAHRISRGMFYKLLNDGRGPTAVKIGRRTLISNEAAEDWRRRMEQEAVVSGQGTA